MMDRRWKPLSILVLLGAIALLPLLQACAPAHIQANPVPVEEPDDEEDEES
jgi:hypothetical protein